MILELGRELNAAVRMGLSNIQHSLDSGTYAVAVATSVGFDVRRLIYVASPVIGPAIGERLYAGEPVVLGPMTGSRVVS